MARREIAGSGTCPHSLPISMHVGSSDRGELIEPSSRGHSSLMAALREDVWLAALEGVRAENQAHAELIADGVGSVLDRSGDAEEIALADLGLLHHPFLGASDVGTTIRIGPSICPASSRWYQ